MAMLTLVETQVSQKNCWTLTKFIDGLMGPKLPNFCNWDPMLVLIKEPFHNCFLISVKWIYLVLMVVGLCTIKKTSLACLKLELWRNKMD